MSADILLQHLSNVKRTGQGNWQASCPTANHAHGDRHPSLNLKIGDNGALIMYCHVGCTAYEIVSAVGLCLSDLYPARSSSQAKPERRPFPAIDLLRCLANESQLVYLCARTVHAGETLSADDLARLLIAVSRINYAMTAGGISHD